LATPTEMPQAGSCPVIHLPSSNPISLRCTLLFN
jgi:hypothetical protein